jgi:membrane-bound lytic murein transglycosylase D
LTRNLAVIFFVLALSACKTLQTNQTPALDISSQDEPLAVVVEATPPLQVCHAQPAPIDPESYWDAWQRVSHQLSLNVPNNRRVRAQKSWYVNHPSYLKRVSKRAEPYLYFIVNELEKRNLPIELALLPIVESAYDPFAYSHGRASGMWQFIPGTGKGYGLSQNWWYDGRRDVFLSTHAALDYLSYLSKRFKGDWLLALAAYNSGQGNVSKAIRKNKKKGKPTDFWSLKLPKETKAYVPKLLALADILRTQRETNVAWSEVRNEPYFTRVATQVQIDLGLAADLSEQSMKEFYQLNPAFNHWATPPKGPHYLLIPIEKAAIFESNLKTIPKNERIAYKRYKIKQGDSLISIANKFSTSVALLKSSNNIRSNNIRAGKSLLIPVASKQREKYSKSNRQRLLAKQNTKRSGNKTTITVAKGDSFWTISRRYKVNLRSLASWNNMAPTDPLKAGQKLVLWTKQPIKHVTLMDYQLKTRKIHYKVRNGDSFAKIADKFNVSLNKIKIWNKSLSRNKYLQPGQSLTLFVDVTKQF